jgi:hypothetical protein
MDASAASQCPYLPGEGWRLPGIRPASIYRNDIAPPQHVMATLAALAQGRGPEDCPTAEWLQAIDVDAMNSPILAFAFRFGLCEMWNGQSRDWFDSARKNQDGTMENVSPNAAMQSLWSGHAGIVRAELITRSETPERATERVTREWAEWNVARGSAFETDWSSKAAWPPGLSLAWHTFEGDWGRIATYFEFGAISNDGVFLCAFEATLMGDEADLRSRSSAEALMSALRRDDARRIVARGRFNGRGALQEIPPVELCALEWSLSGHNGSDGAVLGGGGNIWTNVVLDATSVMKFWPAPSVAVENAKEWASAAEWYTKEGRALAEQRLRERGEKLSELAKASEAASDWNKLHPERTVKADSLDRARKRQAVAKGTRGRGKGDGPA